MVSDLMDAVIGKLDELFGETCRIYTDTVEQGLTKPCFFVSVLESSRKPMLGRRSFQETGFGIQYMPEESEERISHERNRVADILYDGMEYITLQNGDMVRGTKKSFRMKDGSLHFYVSYNLFLMAPAGAAEAMMELQWKGP